jgi:hypothetical protein
MNNHKSRNKITGAAARLQSLVGGYALSLPARLSPTPVLMIGLCDVLVVVQLSDLAECHGQAEGTCDIEGGDGCA